MSSSTSLWTNGLCVTASSLSTPKVTGLLLSDILNAHPVDLCKARFIPHLSKLFTNERTPLLFTLSGFHWGVVLTNSISASCDPKLVFHFSVKNHISTNFCVIIVFSCAPGFPLDKAVSYATLRNPLHINDLNMQYYIQDRYYSCTCVSRIC